MDALFIQTHAKKFIRARQVLLITVLLALFIYVFIRAYNLAFTFDECLSLDIVKGDQVRGKTANNHLLNTWLMYLSYHLFGTKEIYLRLPNVIAFIIYSFFSYKILMQSRKWILMLLGISLLLLNPYMLDFFSLARGYGLALGFSSGAFYFLLESKKNENQEEYLTRFSLSLLFSLLSAYSNLSFINLNLAILLLFFIEWIYLVKNKINKPAKNVTKLFILILLTNLIFLAVLLKHLFFLKTHNELYFGGQTGFLHDTISNLIFDSIYFSNYGKYFWLIIRGIIITLFIITLIYILYYRKYSKICKVTILMSILVLICVSQHYFFDALFPVHRTSLLFIPLFGFLIYYFFFDIYEQLWSKNKKLFNLVLLLMIFPLFFHFITNANFKVTKEWISDCNTKNVMQIISEQHTCNKNLSLSCNWMFEPSVNYYRNLYSMDYIIPVEKTGVDKNSDFNYCTYDESKSFINNNYFYVVENYTETGSVLIKKSTRK